MLQSGQNDEQRLLCHYRYVEPFSCSKHYIQHGCVQHIIFQTHPQILIYLATPSTYCTNSCISTCTHLYVWHACVSHPNLWSSFSECDGPHGSLLQLLHPLSLSLDVGGLEQMQECLLVGWVGGRRGGLYDRCSHLWLQMVYDSTQTLDLDTKTMSLNPMVTNAMLSLALYPFGFRDMVLIFRFRVWIGCACKREHECELSLSAFASFWPLWRQFSVIVQIKLRQIHTVYVYGKCARHANSLYEILTPSVVEIWNSSTAGIGFKDKKKINYCSTSQLQPINHALPKIGEPSTEFSNILQ